MQLYNLEKSIHISLSTNRTQKYLDCTLSWENLCTIQTLQKEYDLGCNGRVQHRKQDGC